MSTECLVVHLPNDVGGRMTDHTPVDWTEHPMLSWEQRCHALLDVLDYHKIVNTEEKRRGTENIGAEMVAKLSYYERWIVSAANVLLQKGILTPDEIAKKTDQVAARFGVTI
jgi:hypothetical protein